MANPEITYDLIEPLIIQENVEGRQVECVFGLPEGGETYESSATIRTQRTATNQIKKQVSRQAVNEVRRTASRLLRSVFGSGFLGRTASQAMNTASRESARNMVNGPSKSDIRAAVVSAFRQVAGNFNYDNSEGRWRKASEVVAGEAKREVVLSDFQKQIQENPVRSGFEKDVLARILAHLAYADGTLAGEELEFFKDSIPSEMGSIEELSRKDQISAIEAEEIPEGVRETMLMLAWVIASIDMEIAQEEVNLINEYAAKFRISGNRADELARTARVYVLEGYMDPEMSRSELFEMAGKLGLTDEEAERAKIHWMKRR